MPGHYAKDYGKVCRLMWRNLIKKYRELLMCKTLGKVCTSCGKLLSCVNPKKLLIRDLTTIVLTLLQSLAQQFTLRTLQQVFTTIASDFTTAFNTTFARQLRLFRRFSLKLAPHKLRARFVLFFLEREIYPFSDME